MIDAMPPARAPKPDLPTIELLNDLAWARWLEENHRGSPGVWLRIAKKGAARSTVSKPEALDTAICFGWIDGQVAPLDREFWLQRFTPRGPRSRWSQLNRSRAERLLAEGRMRPAGLEAVRAAQSDGRWDAAYPPQRDAPVPPDLQRALEENPEARVFFDTLRGPRRYAFIYRLHHVRNPAARRERIATYIEMLSDRRTFR